MYNKMYKFKKTTLNKTLLLKNQQGFTFLEIVVVITIMGFLVAMTVPAIGHISKVQRVKATEKKLEEIKTAIVGKQDIFDDKGLPVVKGYVGDMGELPKLYYSEVDDTGKWKWSKEKTINHPSDSSKEKLELEVIEIDNNGKGQPRGLWMKDWGIKKEDVQLPDGWTKDDLNDVWIYEDLDTDWKGSYISYPKPMYPDAAKNLNPKNDNDKELYEKKHTDGKLIDGWGRVLYFIKEYEKYEEYKEEKVTKKRGIESTATLLIISGGSDGEIKLPDINNDDPEKDEKYNTVADHEDNKDNIVVKITPNEWYKAYNEGKEQETRELLEEIRDALIGSFKATDETGRKKIGGYIGDMGEWPDLYKRSGSNWTKTTEDGGQPIGLWMKDCKKDKDKQIDLGKKWRGPYIPVPWGNELKDGWGNTLKFEVEENEENEIISMTITSGGIDGKIETTNDNLSITINIDEWKNKDTTINDEKKIKETKMILEDIRIALLGTKDARDTTGRLIVGGYLSDMGKWPELYKYNEKKGEWSNIPSNDGQPKNLWIKEKTTGFNPGFRWKGKYLSNPQNAQLKDAWGNPIKFEFNFEEDTKEKTNKDDSKEKEIISMTIRSTWLDDKEFGNSDELKVTIKKSEWEINEDKVTIIGTIYNNKPVIYSDSSDNGSGDTVTVEFFNYNNNNEPASTSVSVSPVKVHIERDKDGKEVGRVVTGGGQAKFKIETSAILGLRKLKVKGGGLDEVVDIFIGEGGSLSPSSDKLNFTIE